MARTAAARGGPEKRRRKRGAVDAGSEYEGVSTGIVRHCLISEG
jgi:hypothetical protein